MPNHWVLQGNPKNWRHPETLHSEPILGWSVTGVEKRVAVGDGVLIWISNADAALRGVYAAGKITGEIRYGHPIGWGRGRQAKALTPFVPLAVYWYLIHNPVNVSDLQSTQFGSHQILTMPRKTAYPCSELEFQSVIDLMRMNGPTAMPVRRGTPFEIWWDFV